MLGVAREAKDCSRVDRVLDPTYHPQWRCGIVGVRSCQRIWRCKKFLPKSLDRSAGGTLYMNHVFAGFCGTPAGEALSEDLSLVAGRLVC